MRELRITEIQAVNGGYGQILVGYAVGKGLDGYFSYASNPSPLFMNTSATQMWINSGGGWGMY